MGNNKINTNAPISDLFEKITEKSKSKDEVSFEFLLDTFGSRTFAPLLLVPAMIILTPLGAIPGVPSIIGTFILLISVQLIAGLKHPWVPKKIDRLAVSRSKLVKAFDTLRKPVNFIEKYLDPRIKFLTSKKIEWIYGLIIALLGLSMIPLEIIPFAAFLPAIGICFISIALLSRDGVLAIFSLVVSSVVAYSVITAV